MDVVVTHLTQEAQDVLGIELRKADGSDLPPFTAGAHVDLSLGNGLCRQYSLANSPRERSRYVLGVGLAPASRGGSAFVHQRLAVGDVVQVSEPRALFGIDASSTEHAFVAGGIGITPILSMIHWCQAEGLPWRLLYCVRTRARAAYAWTLAPHHARVQFHVDEESHALDLQGWLASLAAGAHVYCCGPGGLMDGVAGACAAIGIPRDSTHYERFTAPAGAADQGNAGSFSVILRQSGRRIEVQPEQSLLDALEAAHVRVPFSCREGLCRSCETPLLSGEADHRDFVLSDEERASQRCILPCVSRARSPELMLDL
jgi:tetrachlorobenzoquinone reductase